MKRVFLIVLDSFGVGELPDAQKFGDVGANTLATCYKTNILNVPNMISLGLGSIDGVVNIGKVHSQKGAYGKMAERSQGKDTTTGHWEISGIVSNKPFPTYPDGFPEDIIEKFGKAVGRGILCNKPYSGTAVIEDYGDEHIKTGDLIVYTSADSVFQIAAHEDVVPTEALYDYCKIAREILVGEHAVGRVIARPFKGESGNYYRTPNRRDFSLEPTSETMLDALKKNGKDVIAVGKITDIFANRGITKTVYTHGNAEGMAVTYECLKEDFNGLCFTNLVDFDMLYGHRNDALGYAAALNEFDSWLGDFKEKLHEDDILIITADHGCDPVGPKTDHTREYVPILVYGKKVKPKNLGVIDGFSCISAFVCDYLDVPFKAPAKALDIF